jgi:hypothetical protein
MIIHLRKQYAVGQGFFHVGTLRSSESRSLSYVYDCGAVAAHAGSRDREIDFVIEAFKGRLDFLFLSHFHDDHINGVPALLGRSIHVDTIVMPQIGVLERLIVFAMLMEDDAGVSEFYRDMTVDPVGAVMRFSPRQVVVVRRTGEERDGGAPGDEGPTPDSDLIRDVSDQRDQRWVVVGNGQVLPYIPESSPSEGPESGHVSTMEDVNGFAVMANAQRLWLLAPYVQPGVIDDVAFLAALSGAMNMDLVTLSESLASTAFRRNLVTANAAALRSAYDAVANDLNLTSMSLFSGPGASIERLATGPLMAPYAVSSKFQIAFPSQRALKKGWLGTGDANLAQKRRVNAFLQHYERLLDRVQTLTVPHHGSEASSDRSLFDSVMPDLCVTAAADYKHWRHPAAAVSRQIASCGSASVVVTDEDMTRLTEIVHISA